MPQLFEKCAVCGGKEDFVFYRIPLKGEPMVYCRKCHGGVGKGAPDVAYHYPPGVNYEENIADPKTGKPIPFHDKHSKAAAMKQAGVVEAGDKIHGHRNETKRKTYFV